MKTNLLALVVLFSVMSTIVRAGDEKDEKKYLIPVHDEISRWSVSAGVTLSSIKTTFRGDPNLVQVLSGAGTAGGSPNLYTGGPAAEVYKDGSVGLPGTTDPVDGTTGFTGGTSVLVQNGQFGFSLTQSIFHSTTGALTPLGADSDTGLSVGPYIKLAYLLSEQDKGSLSLFGQYTFTTAFDSGSPAGGSSLINHTFTYDVYHGDLPVTVDGAAVFNATSFNNNIGVGGAGLRAALPPTDVTSGFALGISEPETINIFLHTFTLGIDWTRDLGERVHLVLSTGPTLNLFDYDYSTPGIAVVNGVPVRFAAPQSDASQKLRFGWVGRVGFTFDLDSRKLYFAEVSGEYHWIQNFDVATSLGNATVDASSWGVSLGFGRRF